MYPANGKWGGTITEKTVGKITQEEGYGSYKWWKMYWADGKQYHQNRQSRHVHLYSTPEAAEAQKAADNAEPPWQRRGKMHILSCVALVNYLSIKTGLKPENIQLGKTESGNLHVAWFDKGFHKETMRIGKFYSLSEAKLAPLVELMMPKPKKAKKVEQHD